MSRKPLYRPFGAFRLVLALLVVAQHFLANLAPEPLATASLRYEVGSVAVLVFFSLSGFVISEAAHTVYRDRAGAYCANRLLRIVPLFVLAMAITIFVYFVFFQAGTLRADRHVAFLGQPAFAWGNVFANAIGFLPLSNRLATYDFLSPAWAIRAEMLFYGLLGFALVIASLPRRLGRAPWSLQSVGFVVALGTTPLFVLAMLQKAPEMFRFAPYFVFGCALYVFLGARSRVALAVVGAATMGMVWEFLARPLHHPALGFERAVWIQFAMLAALLAGMALLALVPAGRFRHLDRSLGGLTYPLYLLHDSVMIAALSLTVGYSYAVLAASVLASLLVAALAHAWLDPSVDRLRNAVRGEAIGSGSVTPSAAGAPCGERFDVTEPGLSR